MDTSKGGKISYWFVPYALLWVFAFSIFGMIDAGSGVPTVENFFKPETILVIGAPILFAFIFYWLFNKIRSGWVVLLTLVAGAVMTIETIHAKQGIGEIIFTILIWPILIIPPYFFTKLADKSKFWKITILVLLLCFLAIQCWRLGKA